MKKTKTTETMTDENCVATDRKALNALYGNVTMAKHSVESLLPYVEDKTFKGMLRKQVNKYDTFISDIENVAEKNQWEVTSLKWAQMMADVSIKIKMAVNSGNTNVAKMMMQGTLNGIIDLYVMMRHWDNIDKKITDVAQKLLNYQEDKLDEMKLML